MGHGQQPRKEEIICGLFFFKRHSLFIYTCSSLSLYFIYFREEDDSLVLTDTLCPYNVKEMRLQSRCPLLSLEDILLLGMLLRLFQRRLLLLGLFLLRLSLVFIFHIYYRYRGSVGFLIIGDLTYF
jgi:hypothetical protein